MTPKHTFKTVLVLTLAAICTASYAQSSGTNANESAIVSRMPEFPGGDSAFHKYITDNLKYPEEAKEKGLSVRVFVQFTVNEEGNVENVKIARGIDPALDKEALRVVKSMPKWTPGIQHGRPFKISYTVPVEFKMD